MEITIRFPMIPDKSYDPSEICTEMERQEISAIGKWSLPLEYGAKQFNDADPLTSPIIDTNVDGHPLVSTVGTGPLMRCRSVDSTLLHIIELTIAFSLETRCASQTGAERPVESIKLIEK